MTISDGEYYLYNKIEKDCEIIFDIGCREDSPYIQMTPNKEFHLFEPNPISYNKIKNSLSDYTNKNNKIFINNFGLGSETKDLDYYVESESFMPRPLHFQVSKPTKLHIKKFSEYLKENNIARVDFLKIDTEGWETDILFDDIDFIKSSVKYCQFEYASTWMDRDKIFSLTDVYNIFEDFNFYFLLDMEHPISKIVYSPFIRLEKQAILYVEKFAKAQYGCNIAMTKKELI